MEVQAIICEIVAFFDVWQRCNDIPFLLDLAVGHKWRMPTLKLVESQSNDRDAGRDGVLRGDTCEDRIEAHIGSRRDARADTVPPIQEQSEELSS